MKETRQAQEEQPSLHLLRNKDIEDSGSFQEEHMFSDENSDSSGGDILPNPEEIKKMAPYDQRKDPNAAQNYTAGTKKLHIMYEELEDSGSEGSGPLLNEEANRLASIIEEEEEATEYQRSRSRKSGSLSPVPFSMKAGGSELKKNEESNEKLLSNIEPVAEAPVPPIDIKEVKVDSKRNQKPSSVSARLRGTPRLQKEEKKKKEKVDKKSPKPSELKTMKQKSIEKPSEKSSGKVENKQLKSVALPEKLKEPEAEQIQRIQTPVEESVKLDQPLENIEPVQKQEVQKERNMRSPNNARLGRRDLSERNMSISWQGPKHLKVIFSIFQELGNEKFIDFTDFLKFYLIINEVGNNKKLSGTTNFKTVFEKYRRTVGKPEGNIPHFLWAFMNPDRRKYVKKRTLRGVIKACHDNKGKGRKSLLDSLEESVRNEEGEMSNSSPTSINIRLTFNYPGTKRALIFFSKTLSQIDNKAVTSREVNSFITNALKQSESLPAMIFRDPIHGIEPIVNSEDEDLMNQPPKTMTLPSQMELDAIIPAEKPSENTKKLRKDRSNKTLNDDHAKKTFTSPGQNIFMSNESQQPCTVNQSTQKLKIDYEDGKNSNQL